MNRQEKLHLSADTAYCHCFKHGVFARFYEQALHWFCHGVKTLKPMQEKVQSGEPVIYGGLPISSLEALLEQDRLRGAEITGYGWRWPYAGQEPLPEGTPNFAVWRLETAKSVGCNKPDKGGSDILAEIVAFNLAAHTPMQAMNAIAGWQEALRG